MRKSASEVIRNLERRVARLEKQADKGTLERLQKLLFVKKRIVLNSGTYPKRLDRPDTILSWDWAAVEDDIAHGDSIEVSHGGDFYDLGWRYSGGRRASLLEKKSSKPGDLELAQAIKKYIEEYNNGDVEDLKEDPTYSVTMDEIENTFPRLRKTIKEWDRRGLLQYHSGSVERKSPGGFHLYDEDWDLTTLNEKGAKLVLKLLGL